MRNSNGGGENYNLALNEVLQIVSCQNLAELIQIVKRSNREKKFCSKVFKLVHDVEGKKIDSYKECWRWLRSVIQDFA